LRSDRFDFRDDLIVSFKFGHWWIPAGRFTKRAREVELKAAGSCLIELPLEMNVQKSGA